MAANSEIAFKRLPVKIIGTGSYVPERRLTNADLEKMVDTSHEWIIERTGIVERRIAAPDEYTSHMGTKAAQRALESCGLKPEDAFVDQQFQPRGQHVFRDAEAFLELAEAFNTAKRVSNDQQRPPVADDIQRTGDGAGALFEAGTFHGQFSGGVWFYYKTYWCTP